MAAGDDVDRVELEGGQLGGHLHDRLRPGRRAAPVPASCWRLTISRRASLGSSVRRAGGIRGGAGVAGGADGLVLAGDAAQDAIDVGAVHGLAFQQQLGQAVQGVAVLAQHDRGPVSASRSSLATSSSTTRWVASA